MENEMNSEELINRLNDINNENFSNTEIVDTERVLKLSESVINKYHEALENLGK